MLKHNQRLINPYQPVNHNLCGSKNPNSILTENNVRLMRRRYRNGATIKELTAEYGMSRNQVQRILRRISWRHI